MAKKTEEKILEQTRSTFRAVGKITGVDRDNFYKVQTLERGKAEGKEMRRLNFGLKTSNEQQLRLQMSGIEPDKVMLFDTQNRDKNKKAKRVEMSYDEYYDRKEELDEDKVISYQSRLALERDEDDKLITVHGITFDNVEIASDLLENGMEVLVRGRIERNSYEKDGETRHVTNYNVDQIELLDRELDFDAPDFVEYAKFTESFVFTDTFTDAEQERLVVNGKVINYRQQTENVAYDLSWSEVFNTKYPNMDKMDEKAKEKAIKEIEEQIEMKKMMAKAYKKVKFGSLITIDGDIINRAVVAEQEQETDDLFAMMRGNSRKVTTFMTSLSITGTQEMDEAKYTEDDFVKALEQTEIVVDEKKEEKEDKLGALKGNVDSDAPMFGEDDDEDDLPF